jgi:RNA polymerase sigma factor (sigma-70 family)
VTDDLPSGSLRRSTRLLPEGIPDVDVAAAPGTTDPDAADMPAQNGARMPFDQFYRAEMAPLVRFIRRYGADVYAAADAAHDAFAAIYPQWDAIENPHAWLRLVACRIYYRRRLRETPVEEVPDRPVIYEDPVETGEQGRRVFEALAALPERQRQVMAWHLDGYDNAEIARHLGITDAAVRQNLCRGRQALKQWLGLEKDDPEGEHR